MDLAREEKCEFVPFLTPKRVLTRNNKITGVEFCRSEEIDEGKWIDDESQAVMLKTDFVISAFGSGLYDEDGIYLSADFASGGKEFLSV